MQNDRELEILWFGNFDCWPVELRLYLSRLERKIKIIPTFLFKPVEMKLCLGFLVYYTNTKVNDVSPPTTKNQAD